MAKHYKFSQLFSFSIYSTVSLFTAFLLFNSTSHIHRLSNYNAVLTHHTPPCLPPAYSPSLLELLFFPLKKNICATSEIRSYSSFCAWLISFCIRISELILFLMVEQFSNVCKSNTFSLLHYPLS